MSGTTATPSYSGRSIDNNCCQTMWTALFVVIGLIFFLVTLSQTAFVVEPGYMGIVVTLGHIISFDSGPHMKVPFLSTVEMLSAKTQLLEQENLIPTKEGLAVKLDTAVLYHLEPSQAAKLYKNVGPNYSEILLEPEAASTVRGLTSESAAKALYTAGRNQIQDSLKEDLRSKLGPKGIIIEDVLLKDIVLPDELTKSIEMKVKAEQEAARMEFVLQKENFEAQRKAIEAQGIASFQQIVSEGISEELLKWKGIEATERFGDSPNTKIVIMGNSGGGLPVILSGDDEHAAASSA